jgi:hypothetical protein
VAAIAATALLVVLFQSAPAIDQIAEVETAEYVDTARVKRDTASGGNEGEDCPDELTCVNEDTCCDDWKRTFAGDEKKRKKGGKKPKGEVLTVKQTQDVMIQRYQDTLKKAIDENTSMRRRNPEYASAAFEPTAVQTEIGDMLSANANALMDKLMAEDQVDCSYGNAGLTFKTNHVFIAYPQTYDYSSLDKQARYEQYISFANSLHSKLRSAGRAKLYVSPYSQNNVRFSKEVKSIVNNPANSEDFALNTNHMLVQHSWSKIIPKAYNDVLKRIGSNVNTAGTGNSCFLIMLFHEIPRDYSNVINSRDENDFNKLTEKCTMIPIFVSPGGNDHLFDDLASVAQFGGRYYNIADKMLRGHYHVHSDNGKIDQSAFSAVEDAIISFMCMTEHHALCRLRTMAYVEPEEDAEDFRAATTEDTVTAAEASEDDGGSDPTDAPEETQATDAGTTAPATEPIPIEDSCCGPHPMAALSFDQNQKSCCFNSGVAPYTIAYGDAC